VTKKFPPLRPRTEWLLDPQVTFLNHGSFGATPRNVLAEQARWRERMERHPTGFMTFELPAALREAAARLAAFVGAAAPDLVFVENATAGCNAVLASLALAAGDEILLTDHGYAAVRNAAAHVAARTGARIVEATIRCPVDGPSAIIEAVAQRLGPRTRLVILDHVTSPTAAILPVRELTALCRAAGAQVLIDGAHAPGMLALDVPAIGADWYVGNCHKWLMAPKGAGFLWASPAARENLHPPVISHGYGQGFVAEFDWVGTRDPTAWLAIPAAIDVHAALGGPALRERNAGLARAAANLLADRWGTERATSDALTGAMATVRLPVREPGTAEAALRLRTWLFEARRIEVAVMPFAGALWARVSAQAYNEPADYQRLADAFAR
jgi:isopenicillin-N epimerase